MRAKFARGLSQKPCVSEHTYYGTTHTKYNLRTSVIDTDGCGCM